jgi:hypothetical protein
LCAKAATKRPKTKEETVKAFKTYLAITATMLVTAAAAQAGNPTAAQLRGLEDQGQALNIRCQTSTLSREGFTALCGAKGSQHQPTAGELRAYEIRGRAMNSLSQPAVSRQNQGWYRALQIRGAGMQNLSQSSTLSREGFVALFGTRGAESHPTAAQLRALEIRGQGIQDLAQSSTLSREGYVALFGTKGASQHPTAAALRAYEIRGEAMNRLPVASSPVTPATPFAWRDFGFGAVAGLGFVLLAGGIAAGIRYGHKADPHPRTVS